MNNVIQAVVRYGLQRVKRAVLGTFNFFVCSPNEILPDFLVELVVLLEITYRVRVEQSACLISIALFLPVHLK